MTQAYNLSQLANNLNSSGQLDATDGLVNAVPVANGGTGASTASAARTNLGVPSTTGSGASGTWGISVTGSSSSSGTSAECSGNAATVTNGVYTTGDQTIGGTKTFTNGVRFNDGTTQTTAAPPVMTTIASASVGAVGTYAMAVPFNITGTWGPGATISGGSLRFAAASVYNQVTSTGQGQSANALHFVIDLTALSGTWRSMGYSQNAYEYGYNNIDRPTLWLRIS